MSVQNMIFQYSNLLPTQPSFLFLSKGRQNNTCWKYSIHFNWKSIPSRGELTQSGFICVLLSPPFPLSFHLLSHVPAYPCFPPPLHFLSPCTTGTSAHALCEYTNSFYRLWPLGELKLRRDTNSG